jgi:hypothetical protein
MAVISRRANDLAAARARLPVVARRFCDLVAAIEHPDRASVGTWTTADVAAHVSHVAAGEAFVASTVGNTIGGGLPVGDDLPGGAAAFNARNLTGDPERNPRVLAERVEASVAQLLEVMEPLRGDEQVAWLGGLVLPASALPCHLLGELLVHGHDVARAEGRPWPMEPVESALGFGFLMDAIRLSPEPMRRAYVHEEARATKATFELRVRGGRTYVLVFDRGSLTVVDPPRLGVDCRVSLAPAAALLTAFGRTTVARTVLTGAAFAWGRKPWLAPKLPRLLRNP